MSTNVPIKKTALHSLHRALKARMVEFGGWEMPIEYSGIIQEHLAVRTAAGLFDISHMGEIRVCGPESLHLIQKVTCNDASRLKDGQIQYSALLYPEGTFVDDILVHRLDSHHYLLCVNASNTPKDFEWICRHNDFNAVVENVSSQYAQLAIQGPNAEAILQRLTELDLRGIRYYWFRQAQVEGIDALVSRTGYTGEDGFELYFPPEYSEQVWNRLMETGRNDGLKPAGLGARNTLRLEAKMALYGHEISEKMTPWEAGLCWIVKLEKDDFLGKSSLLAQQRKGLSRRLVGFEMVGRGIARDGYAVMSNEVPVGHVTSGGPAPFLKKNIGLAYVPVALSAVGTGLEIQVREQRVAARVVETPFYKRAL